MPNTRGNTYIKYGNGNGVYLYTAKYGYALPAIVQNALLRTRPNWGDTATVARAIFAEIIQKDVFNLNDAGISLTLENNENFIVVVDDKSKLVGIFGETGHCYNKFDFDTFLGFPNNSLNVSFLTGGARIERERAEMNRNRPDPYPMSI